MKANKKYLISTVISSALMFIWIFITVFLTGGREIYEFTETDKLIFSCFIMMEILTVFSIIVILVKMDRYNKQNGNFNSNTINTQPTAGKAPLDKRKTIINIVVFMIIFSVMICGILTDKKIGVSYDNYFGIALLVSLAVPILGILANILLNRLYIKSLNRKSIRERQDFILSHRDNAEQNARKKLSLLKRIRILSDIYAVFLGVCSLSAAFCLGIIYDNSVSMTLLFIIIIISLAAVSRIRHNTSKSYFEDDKTYVSESDYPALYAIARKAAEQVGLTGNIRIALLNDFNAGAAKINNQYSIQLGTLLLNVLSEEEVYCVLLHEFAHIKSEDSSWKEIFYSDFLYTVYNVTTPNIYTRITKNFFVFLDNYYKFQFQLYMYAASLTRERIADEAMLLSGNPKLIASSLLKIKYYELYNWEKGTYDEECFFEPETYDIKALEKEAEKFKEAIKENTPKWNSFIQNEILSRSATHPTLKMRLENLGIKEFTVLNEKSSESYTHDAKKAISYVGNLIYELNKDSYVEARKYSYTKSKELINKWEANGKPLVAEEYYDICDALRNLGRNLEALDLCERAILELDEAAACYAHFIKGCFLIHTYDEAGIEHIYHAIKNNHNFIDEGLAAIGEFCCLTGQEEQLEIYRERAIAITEENKDIYFECGVLNKKDRLSQEEFPEGMLEEILTHILSADKGVIENIYLVRKTITDDFFTSVFVIKMTEDTDDDSRYDIMHKTFNYLDTYPDWQFSLFDYEEVKNVKIESIPNSCVYSK